LVGYETKEVTYRTNDWDNVETIGGHRKFFALWPLYFHNDIRQGTDNPEKQRVFLPFYSWQKSPQRDSLTLLWPLFTITDDREQGYREVDAPWPLIVFARGEGKTANRVWPLFSRVTTETKQDEFYLWPLYKRTRTDSEPLRRQRTRLLFFLYSDIRETNTATRGTRQRTDLWPLFTAEKDWEGNERLQLLALLEPLLPGSKSVVRNYSSLWSIWRSKKNPETGRSSQSLLWNLYRRDKTPATSKYSFLFGLVQFQSGPQGNRWRWFHWPQDDPPPESIPAGSNPE
jgi:hypothetical protein